MMPEQIELLGEIRDQLKRIADLLEKLVSGEAILGVDIGEPTVRTKEVTPVR